jgi:hypothetical protein
VSAIAERTGVMVRWRLIVRHGAAVVIGHHVAPSAAQ